MAYCKYCGAPIDDNAVICPKCGIPQVSAPPEEGGTIGWGVLGFFLPVVGLILFLVWRDTKPRSSRAAGIGALISTVGGLLLGLFVGLIFLIITVGLAGMAAGGCF